MKRYGVDSVHSWILVVVSTFILLTTVGSTLGSSGVIYKAFLDVQQLTEEEASWPLSIHAGTTLFTGPIAAIMSTRLSIRTIATLGILFQVLGSSACFLSTNITFVSLFYGVLGGIGHNTPYVLIIALITRIFKKYRTTAMGIVISAIPIGALVFPLTTNALLERYGLRGTFLMLGAVYMQGFLGSVLLVDHESQKTGESGKEINFQKDIEEKRKQTTSNLKENQGIQPQFTYSASYNVESASTVAILNSHNNDTTGDRKFSSGNTAFKSAYQCQSNGITQGFITLFETPGFYLCSTIQNVCFLLYFMYVLIILDYATKKNISYSKSLSLLITFFAGQILGRFGLGWLTDKNLLPKTVQMALVFCVISILCFVLPVVYHFECLVFITALFSTLVGNLVPLSNVMFAEYIPKENIIFALSVSVSFGGGLSFLRSVLIGAFSGGNSSYDHLFIFLGVLAIGTSLMTLSVYLWNKKLCIRNELQNVIVRKQSADYQ